MKRAYLLYGISALFLALLCVVLVRVSRLSSVGGALGKLGRSELEFRQVRESVLMSPGDPGPALVAYAANARHSRSARVDALRILGEAAEHSQTSYGVDTLVTLLADTSRSVKLELLRTLACYRSDACLDAVARIFGATPDSAVLQQCLHTLGACATPLRQRLEVATGAGDVAGVDSCVTAAGRLPAGRTALMLKAARFYLSHGDSSRSRELSEGLGIVHDFWAVGPFPMQRTTEYCREFGPETKPFDSTEQFTVAGGVQRGWERLHDDAWDGAILLTPYFADVAKSVGYFMTFLNAGAEHDAFVFFGSSEGIRAWFNGSEILTDKRLDILIVDNSVARVTLRPGPNELLIRIDRYLGSWGMSCRVTGTDGNALPDVKCSPIAGSR